MLGGVILQKSHVTKHVTLLPPVERGFTSFFSYVTVDPFPYELSGKPLHFRFADTFTSSVIYSLFVGVGSDQPCQTEPATDVESNS